MIEFFYWRECPSHERALAMLVEELNRHGVARDHVRITEIRTEADAQRERFRGSPTIVFDGVDLQDPGDQPVGLTCRVYRKRDGRISPLPDEEDLRDAVAAYAARIGADH